MANSLPGQVNSEDEVTFAAPRGLLRFCGRCLAGSDEEKGQRRLHVINLLFQEVIAGSWVDLASGHQMRDVIVL